MLNTEAEGGHNYSHYICISVVWFSSFLMCIDTWIKYVTKCTYHNTAATHKNCESALPNFTIIESLKSKVRSIVDAYSGKNTHTVTCARAQRVLFLLSVVLLKEPFLCVLGETYQNTLLCSTTWPADHSDVLLKLKQACDCCSAQQAAIELSDGRNDKVAFSHQNNSKLIKRNPN